MNPSNLKVWKELVANASPGAAYLYCDDDDISAAILAMDEYRKGLEKIAEKANDVEGMAKVIYEHMFSDRDGWEKELNEWLRGRYVDNATAVSEFIKGGK